MQLMGRAANVRKVTKARTDGAKAKNNGRFAKKIIMAVKAGGVDTTVNRQLAQVIEEAKVANVPKDIIQRNIEKASAATTANFKESVFEFYGHGGAGLLVNVLTDNDNRAAKEVHLAGKKLGLKPATANSVAFKFVKKARIDLQAAVPEDVLLDLCLAAGVEDYEQRTAVNGCPLSPTEEGRGVVYVGVSDMSSLRDALRGRGYQLEARLVQVPLDGFLQMGDEAFEANLAAISAFEALDDVDSVEHNIDMTDDSEEGDGGEGE